MTGLGTLVCDGQSFAVTDVHLTESVIRINAVTRGPLPACDGKPVTVFGSDGRGICQSAALLSWPAIGPGVWFNVHYDLTPMIGTVITGEPA